MIDIESLRAGLREAKNTEQFGSSRKSARREAIAAVLPELVALRRLGHSSPMLTLSTYARSMEGMGRIAVGGLAKSLLGLKDEGRSV